MCRRRATGEGGSARSGVWKWQKGMKGDRQRGRKKKKKREEKGVSKGPTQFKGHLAKSECAVVVLGCHSPAQFVPQKALQRAAGVTMSSKVPLPHPVYCSYCRSTSDVEGERKGSPPSHSHSHSLLSSCALASEVDCKCNATIAHSRSTAPLPLLGHASPASLMVLTTPCNPHRPPLQPKCV